MNTVDSERYSGKPLLRLLECYTLHSIGHLEMEHEQNLQAMTPKLQEIYKIKGTWIEIISKIMEFPPNMPSLIQEMWQKNQKIAEDHKTPIAPQKFAEMFVDSNLR